MAAGAQAWRVALRRLRTFSLGSGGLTRKKGVICMASLGGVACSREVWQRWARGVCGARWECGLGAECLVLGLRVGFSRSLVESSLRRMVDWMVSMFRRISLRHCCVDCSLGDRWVCLRAGLPSLGLINKNAIEMIKFISSINSAAIDNNSILMQPDSEESDSMIYLSPHSAKYPKQQPHSLLDDEALPFHLQERFAQGHRTPDRQHPRPLPLPDLNKSSSNKPLLAPDLPDPFVHFENDHIDPNILSKGKEEPKDEGKEEHRSPGSGSASRVRTAKKKRQFEEMNISKLLASPKKQLERGLNPAVKEERPLQEEYAELIAGLPEGAADCLAGLFFFEGEAEPGMTKLLCFDLNSKNARCVKFDPESQTCQPHFRCYGCGRDFLVAAALGGHLSKCQLKQEHLYRSAHVLHLDDSSDDPHAHNDPNDSAWQGSSAPVKLEDSDSFTPNRKRGPQLRRERRERRERERRQRRDGRRLVRKAPKGKPARPAAGGVGVRQRHALARVSKTFANLVIHQVIQRHFH